MVGTRVGVQVVVAEKAREEVEEVRRLGKVDKSGET